MRPLPFSNGPAAVIFCAAYVIFIAVEIRVGIRGRTSTAQEHDDGTKNLALGLLWLGMAAAFGLALAVPATSIPTHRWLWFAVGITAMMAGTGLRQWAINTLGTFFTLEVRVADDHTVIDHGPYRWLRHPAYSASLLTFTGLGLALGNWLALIVVVALPLAGYLRRIQVEERVLRAELGEPYARYAASHRRLIPGIW